MKHLEKASSPNTAEKVRMMQNRISIVEKFVEARN